MKISVKLGASQDSDNCTFTLELHIQSPFLLLGIVIKGFLIQAQKLHFFTTTNKNQYYERNKTTYSKRKISS